MRNPTRAFATAAMLVLASAGAVSVAVAGTKLSLGRSVEIPAALGELKLKDTRNGNIELKLAVKHLAPPGRIVPGASVFVVWARGLSAGTDAQNLGLLKVNANLSGKFAAVTAMQSFDVFLTCEQSPTALFPSGPQLLPVHYQHK